MACDEATTELSEAITEALSKPRRVRGDEGEVEMHSIREMIEADKYLKSQCATSKPGRGIRFTKLIPPGTV